MDWNCLRRCLNSSPYGIQGQISYCDRNRHRFDNFLAVSDLPAIRVGNPLPARWKHSPEEATRAAVARWNSVSSKFANTLFSRRATPFTYFPDTPDGNDRHAFFSQVVAFHPIHRTLGQQQWDLSGGYGTHFALALFTFLYVDIIDCTATLYSMARFCNKVRKGDGDFPRSTIAYCTDAFCISIGALLGCSPVTAFIESGAGIAEGGRTGLTAMVAGFCFLISIFFAPIFASIPPWATGCTLIMVSRDVNLTNGSADIDVCRSDV